MPSEISERFEYVNPTYEYVMHCLSENTTVSKTMQIRKISAIDTFSEIKLNTFIFNEAPLHLAIRPHYFVQEDITTKKMISRRHGLNVTSI